MTSPWRHNFTWNYMSRSNYVLSFNTFAEADAEAEEEEEEDVFAL